LARRPDPKLEERNSYRINEQIRVPEVRLVGDNLDEISETVNEKVEPGVYPFFKVRKWAELMQEDMVEISPNAVPPVVKIIDFNKFLYAKRRKEKEMKSNQVKQVLKEIRFGPNTDEHDFEFKLKHATEFLQEGNKIKAYVHFKGRTIVYKERGELLLLRFLKALEELGVAESLPKLEGRRMLVVITPKKGPAKKG
jgi:translation initiation factor IF-3